MSREPFYPDSAAQRTELARQRSGLSLAVVGALLLKQHTALALAAGVLVLACALLVYARGATRALAPLTLLAGLAALLAVIWD
jgi:hypothetical protein